MSGPPGLPLNTNPNPVSMHATTPNASQYDISAAPGTYATAGPAFYERIPGFHPLNFTNSNLARLASNQYAHSAGMFGHQGGSHITSAPPHQPFLHGLGAHGFTSPGIASTSFAQHGFPRPGFNVRPMGASPHTYSGFVTPPPPQPNPLELILQLQKQQFEAQQRHHEQWMQQQQLQVMAHMYGGQSVSHVESASPSSSLFDNSPSPLTPLDLSSHSPQPPEPNNFGSCFLRAAEEERKRQKQVQQAESQLLLPQSVPLNQRLRTPVTFGFGLPATNLPLTTIAPTGRSLLGDAEATNSTKETFNQSVTENSREEEERKKEVPKVAEKSKDATANVLDKAETNKSDQSSEPKVQESPEITASLMQSDAIIHLNNLNEVKMADDTITGKIAAFSTADSSTVALVTDARPKVDSLESLSASDVEVLAPSNNESEQQTNEQQTSKKTDQLASVETSEAANSDYASSANNKDVSDVMASLLQAATSSASVVSSTTVNTSAPINEANKSEIQIEIAHIEMSESMSVEQSTTKAADLVNVFDLPSVKLQRTPLKNYPASMTTVNSSLGAANASSDVEEKCGLGIKLPQTAPNYATLLKAFAIHSLDETDAASTDAASASSSIDKPSDKIESASEQQGGYDSSAILRNPDWLSLSKGQSIHRVRPSAGCLSPVTWYNTKNLKETASNQLIMTYCKQHPEMFGMKSAAEFKKHFGAGFTPDGRRIVTNHIVKIKDWAEQSNDDLIDAAERSQAAKKAEIQRIAAATKKEKEEKRTKAMTTTGKNKDAAAASVFPAPATIAKKLPPAVRNAVDVKATESSKTVENYYMPLNTEKGVVYELMPPEGFTNQKMNGAALADIAFSLSITTGRFTGDLGKEFNEKGVSEHYLRMYKAGVRMFNVQFPSGLDDIATSCLPPQPTPSEPAASADHLAKFDFDDPSDDLVSAAANQVQRGVETFDRHLSGIVDLTKSTRPKQQCYSGAATKKVSLQSMYYVPLATMTKPVWVEVPPGLGFALRMIDTATLSEVAVFARRRASQPIVDPVDTFKKEGVPYEVLQKYLKSTGEKFTPFKVLPDVLTGTSSPPLPMDTSSAFDLPATESASASRTRTSKRSSRSTVKTETAGAATEKFADGDDFATWTEKFEATLPSEKLRSASQASHTSTARAPSETASATKSVNKTASQTAATKSKLPFNYGPIPPILFTQNRPRNLSTGLLYERCREATPDELTALREYQADHIREAIRVCLGQCADRDSEYYFDDHAKLEEYLAAEDLMSAIDPPPDPETPALPKACWLPSYMHKSNWYGPDGRTDRLGSTERERRNSIHRHQVETIEGAKTFGAAFFRFRPHLLNDLRGYDDFAKLDFEDFIKTRIPSAANANKMVNNAPHPHYHRVMKDNEEYDAYIWHEISTAEAESDKDLVELKGCPKTFLELTRALLKCKGKSVGSTKIFKDGKAPKRIEIPISFEEEAALLESGKLADLDKLLDAFFKFLRENHEHLVFYSFPEIAKSATDDNDHMPCGFDEHNRHSALYALDITSDMQHSSSAIKFTPLTPSPITIAKCQLATFVMNYEGTQVQQFVSAQFDDKATEAEKIIFKNNKCKTLEHGDRFYDFRILARKFNIPVGYHVSRPGDLTIILEGARYFTIVISRKPTLETSWYYASPLWVHAIAAKHVEDEKAVQFETLEEEVPAEAMEEEIPTKAIDEEVPIEAIDEKVSIEAIDEEVPAEAIEAGKAANKTNDKAVQCGDGLLRCPHAGHVTAGVYKTCVAYCENEGRLPMGVCSIPLHWSTACLRCKHFPKDLVLDKTTGKRKYQDLCRHVVDENDEANESDSDDNNEVLVKKLKIETSSVVVSSQRSEASKPVGGESSKSGGSHGKQAAKKPMIKDEPEDEKMKKTRKAIPKVGLAKGKRRLGHAGTRSRRVSAKKAKVDTKKANQEFSDIFSANPSEKSDEDEEDAEEYITDLTNENGEGEGDGGATGLKQEVKAEEGESQDVADLSGDNALAAFIENPSIGALAGHIPIPSDMFLSGQTSEIGKYLTNGSLFTGSKLLRQHRPSV